MQSLQFFQRIEYDTNCNSDIGNRVFEADPTDWAFRIRKDVPPWVLKLVLIGGILLIAGLQYLNVL